MNARNLKSLTKAHSVRAISSRCFRPALAVLVAGSFVLTGLMPRVKAAAGDVDPTFGNGGEVITDFPGKSRSTAQGIAIQADGKIVVAGSSLGHTDLSADFEVFSLARYHQDGTLDATFGTGGRVNTIFPNAFSNRCFAVAIQPDGKIVAGGDAFLQFSQNFALARYNVDGSLDASFASGGTFVLPLPIGDEPVINALAIQTDGRIIVAGQAELSPSKQDFFVLRLNSDGTLDGSFGFGGIAVISFGSNFAFLEDVALQTDGRILVSGEVLVPEGNTVFSEFGVARLNPDGSLDTSFGVGGEVITEVDNPSIGPLGSGADARSVRPLPDGRILVGGGLNCDIARYLPNGDLDSSFGVGGKAVDSFPGGPLMLLPNGQLIIAGNYIVNGGFGTDFSLTRFNSDGTQDDTFGNFGNVRTSFALDGNAKAATIYGSDQIIIAGDALEKGNPQSPIHNFALVRFLGDPAPRSADLEVTTSAFLSSDGQGNRFITYRITVADLGPDPAHYVTLTDHLPHETIFQSIEVPDGWVVYRKPGQSQRGFGLQPVISVSSALVGLRKEPATITVVVKVRSPGPHTLTNNASVVSSFDPDPNLLNNSVTTTTPVP
jgi:uncharacterized delta-60 repeat protein